METFDEHRRTEIDSFAKLIVERIRGGKMYGVEVDMTNMCDIVVAAYFLGISHNYPDYNLFFTEKET